MCLAPIKLYNPKKRVSLQGGHLFEIEVPCGECAECQENKKNEWYFRTYYEAQSTFDTNGYVYFDTLTYRDADLPHINDYLSDNLKLSNLLNVSCFSTEDYRLFFVRLRRRLEYDGYQVAGNLKYFLTSEYGDDDRYTHRPHYHVLFFVKLDIDPLKFSHYVNEAWQKGRTDGIDYKPGTYVLNHVFGPKYNCDKVHLQIVCNYVAKYVTKDSEFSATVESRLNVAFNRLYGENWRDDDADESRDAKYKKLRKEMLQFHRQSHGFGEDFLKYNKIEDVLETGMISMPDKDDIVKHMPLPGYYSTKLFYDLVRDCNGSLSWKLNELGKAYKLDRAVKCTDLMKKKFEEWLINMKNYSYYHDSNDKEWYDRIYKRFVELNGERDLGQFAIYLVFYKGRIKSVAQRERERNGVFYVDNPIDFYHDSMDEVKQFGPEMYYYGSKTDRYNFGMKFITTKYLGDTMEWRNNGGIPHYIARWFNYVHDTRMFQGYTPNLFKHEGKNRYFGWMIKPDVFKMMYVMNDSCDERFKDYDKMWSLYCEAQLDKNDFKETTYKERIALKKRLKRAGVYVSNI